jgi:hypothetical protein
MGFIPLIISPHVLGNSTSIWDEILLSAGLLLIPVFGYVFFRVLRWARNADAEEEGEDKDGEQT